MAVDLASIFVTKGFEWGIGKALDVLWNCATRDCRERRSERIANVQYNALYCTNCHREHHQFTNACNHTVNSEGLIAQVGVSFGDFSHIRDTPGLVGEVFGWRCINVRSPVWYRCEGFGGQDLIEVNDVIDLKTNTKVFNDISHFKPESDSFTAERWLIMPRSKIGEQRFIELFENDSLLAFDTRVENKYRDVLLKDRVLHQL